MLCLAGATRDRLERPVRLLGREHRIVAHLAGRGIEFPSEHNARRLYEAKPGLAGFDRALDPTNTMDPGIGGTSWRRNWA